MGIKVKLPYWVPYEESPWWMRLLWRLHLIDIEYDYEARR